MKALVVVLLVASGCEHDPRYERHEDRRPPPAASVPVDADPAKTVERHVVDIPPMHVPNVAPIDKRTRRHRRH